MNDVQDQLRSAGRAVTSQVTSLPELRLTPERAGSRVPRPGGGRRWLTWAAPAAAMAMVVAVAVALVAVRGMGGAGTAQPGGTATAPAAGGSAQPASQLPAYYVAAALRSSVLGSTGMPVGTRPGEVIVGDVRTGKAVTTITPPAGHTLAEVVGAADGTAFVVDMPSASSHDFFMYRPATAGGTAPRSSPLTLRPSLAGDGLLGLALSPDGSRFAVLVQQRSSGHPADTAALRIYSTTTGVLQRQWTMPAPYGMGENGANNAYSLTWTGNGQELAFTHDLNRPVGVPGLSVYFLNLNSPGSDLRADSRIVSVQVTGDQCESILFTPDGKTVICGGEDLNNKGCAHIRPRITEYSALTGKLTRVLYQYDGACAAGMAYAFWSNPSGTSVAVGIQVKLPGSGKVVTSASLISAQTSAQGHAQEMGLPMHFPAADSAQLLIGNLGAVAF